MWIIKINYRTFLLFKGVKTCLCLVSNTNKVVPEKNLASCWTQDCVSWPESQRDVSASVSGSVNNRWFDSEQQFGTVNCSRVSDTLVKVKQKVSQTGLGVRNPHLKCRPVSLSRRVFCLFPVILQNTGASMKRTVVQESVMWEETYVLVKHTYAQSIT